MMLFEESSNSALTNPPRNEDIFKSINKFNWDVCIKLYEEYRNDRYCTETSYVKCMNKKGNTPLHELCNIGSVPIRVMEKILEMISLNDNAQTTMVQNKYGDTPLHIVCKASQRSVNKLALLLKYIDKSNCLTVRNNEGKTALHVACSSNAWFPVIFQLTKSNPLALLMEDNLGYTPVMTLWMSHICSTPFRFTINEKLGELGHTSNRYEEFWKKMVFLLMETYKIDRHYNQSIPCDILSCGTFEGLIHAIFCYIYHDTDLLYSLALLKKSQENYCTFDKDGNLPVHILCSKKNKMLSLATESSHASWCKILSKCLEHKESFSIPDKEGRLPLHKIIEFSPLKKEKSSHRWEKLIELVTNACPNALGTPDIQNHLYPFMIAASKGSLDQTFQLLMSKPELISPRCDS